MMLVFLDACCLIYAVENRANEGDAVRAAVMDLPDTTRLATTELVRFECIIQPLRMQDFATLNEYDEILADCVFLQLGRREFDLAAQLRAAHGLSSLDA